jgi:hypothetical protein
MMLARLPSQATVRACRQCGLKRKTDPPIQIKIPAKLITGVVDCISANSQNSQNSFLPGGNPGGSCVLPADLYEHLGNAGDGAEPFNMERM